MKRFFIAINRFFLHREIIKAQRESIEALEIRAKSLQSTVKWLQKQHIDSQKTQRKLCDYIEKQSDLIKTIANEIEADHSTRKNLNNIESLICEPHLYDKNGQQAETLTKGQIVDFVAYTRKKEGG
jgi:hypothetical protein